MPPTTIAAVLKGLDDQFPLLSLERFSVRRIKFYEDVDARILHNLDYVFSIINRAYLVDEKIFFSILSAIQVTTENLDELCSKYTNSTKSIAMKLVLALGEDIRH